MDGKRRRKRPSSKLCRCEVCEEPGVFPETGMCAVCTFGEADAAEWDYDGLVYTEQEREEYFRNQRSAEDDREEN